MTSADKLRAAQDKLRFILGAYDAGFPVKARMLVRELSEDDLRTLLAEQEWRPIESAPRDGTRVLIIGRRGMEVAWWQIQPGHETGWMAVDGDDPEPVTCYQPLPEPPKGGE